MSLSEDYDAYRHFQRRRRHRIPSAQGRRWVRLAPAPRPGVSPRPPPPWVSGVVCFALLSGLSIWGLFKLFVYVDAVVWPRKMLPFVQESSVSQGWTMVTDTTIPANIMLWMPQGTTVQLNGVVITGNHIEWDLRSPVTTGTGLPVPGVVPPQERP